MSSAVALLKFLKNNYKSKIKSKKNKGRIPCLMGNHKFNKDAKTKKKYKTCDWRRKRDLNPRYGYPYYSLSRGAPSASWVFLHCLIIISQINCFVKAFFAYFTIILQIYV